MWTVLSFHSKGHDFIYTVNRLFGEKAKLHGHIPPTLVESELAIFREEWKLADLWKLLQPTQVVDLEPHSFEPPLVAVHWSSEVFLIDGRRRINSWHRSGNNGPHPIYVLYARVRDNYSTGRQYE